MSKVVMEFGHPYDDQQAQDSLQSGQRLRILAEGRYLYPAQPTSILKTPNSANISHHQQQHSKFAPRQDPLDSTVSLFASADQSGRMQYYVITSPPRANHPDDVITSPPHAMNHSGDHRNRKAVNIDRSYENNTRYRNVPNHGAEKTDLVDCHSAGCSSPASSLKSTGEAQWSPSATDIPRIPDFNFAQRVQHGYRLSSEIAVPKTDSLSPSPRSFSYSRQNEDHVFDTEGIGCDQPLNLSILRRVEDDVKMQYEPKPDSNGDLKSEYSDQDSLKQISPVPRGKEFISNAPTPSLLSSTGQDSTPKANDSDVDLKFNSQKECSPKVYDNDFEEERGIRERSIKRHEDELNPRESSHENTDICQMETESMPPSDTWKTVISANNCVESFKVQLSSPVVIPDKTTKKRRYSSKNHPCPFCGKAFALPWKLKIHIRVHTGEKPYQCHVCGKRFSVRCNLRDHIQLHTGDRPWKCPKCPAKFSWPSQLKAHNRVHSGEKPYKCQYCTMSFAWSSSRTHHERGHRGERRYQCRICSTTFQRKYALLDHLRTHEGAKPFTCTVCKKLFSNKNSLKQHERKHTEEAPEEAPHVCSCGDIFRTTRLFRKHQSVLHNKEYPYVCRQCFINFRCERDLEEHDKILHYCNQKEELRSNVTSSNDNVEACRSNQELLDASAQDNDVQDLSRKTFATFCDSETSLQHTRRNNNDGLDNHAIRQDYLHGDDPLNCDKAGDESVQDLSQKSNSCSSIEAEESKATSIPQTDNMPQLSSVLKYEEPLDFSGSGTLSRGSSPSGSMSPNLPLLSSDEPSPDTGLDLRKANVEQYFPNELLITKSAFRNKQRQTSPEKYHLRQHEKLENECIKTGSAFEQRKRYRMPIRKEPYPVYNQATGHKNMHSPSHDRALAEFISRSLSHESDVAEHLPHSPPSHERVLADRLLHSSSHEISLAARHPYSSPSHELALAEHHSRIPSNQIATAEPLSQSPAKAKVLAAHISHSAYNDRAQAEHISRSSSHERSLALADIISRSPQERALAERFSNELAESLSHSPSHNGTLARFLLPSPYRDISLMGQLPYPPPHEMDLNYDRALAQHVLIKLPSEDKPKTKLTQLLNEQPRVNTLPGRYVYQPLTSIGRQVERKQNQKSKDYEMAEDSCQIHLPCIHAEYKQLHSKHAPGGSPRFSDLYVKL